MRPPGRRRPQTATGLNEPARKLLAKHQPGEKRSEMISLEETRAGLLRVERLNLTLSAGAVAAAFAFFSPHIAGSVALGAALEALNFRTLHAAARKFFATGLEGASPWLGLLGLRLVLLMGAVVLVLLAGANAVALLIGLSMVCPAVVIDAWRHRPAIVDPGDYPVPVSDDPSWDRVSVWNFWAADDAPDDWDEPGR
jgi:hypothetical protein